MELSINFLVSLILAIAMFSAGMFIAVGVFTSIKDVQKNAEERIMEDLRDALRSNGIVFSTEHTTSGNAAKFYYAASSDTAIDVYLDIRCDLVTYKSKVICDDDAVLPCDEFDSWVHVPGPMHIAAGTKHEGDFFIIVPEDASKGTYVYDVRAYTDEPLTQQYGQQSQVTLVND